jgi:transcriptional regulator with XRE-family HTH domain
MAGETDASFGDIVSAARKRRAWSLRQLAEKVLNEEGDPVTPQYLNDIEHGRRIPADHVIKQLAKALGVSADRLFHQARRLPPDIASDKVSAKKVEKAYQAFRKALKDP